MTKFLANALIASALIAAPYTFAAELSSCVDKVQSACYTSVGLDNRMWDSGNSGAKECKIVQRAGGSDSVVFIRPDGGRITSVDTGDCTLSDYQFQTGVVVANRVFEGRLFAVLSSGKVVVVARDNALYQLMNSEGNPYSAVTGLKVEDGKIVLERGNDRTVLTLQQIDDRIQSAVTAALQARSSIKTINF